MSEKIDSLVTDRPISLFENQVLSQFIPVRGLENKILSMDKNNGYVYFATDTGKIYIDTETENKALMGGSSGIFYANHVHQDTPSAEQKEFEFSIDDLEDKTRTPNVDDLILNLLDGCFYRVKGYDDSDNTIIHVERITLAGGGGGSQIGGNASIKWHTTTPITAVDGKSFAIEFTLKAIDAEGLETSGHEYIVKADRMESGTPTKIVKRGSLENGFNSIEIGEYLNEIGTWRVRVETTLEVGGTAPVSIVKNFTINVTTISLVWDYDIAQLNNIENNFILKDWRFIGAGENKKLHIIIDDYNKIDPIILSSGQTAYEYSFKPIDKGISHGVHKIEIYGTIEINGELITTDAIHKNIIFYEDGNGITLISHNLDNTNLVQHSTVSIPIVIYSPKNSAEGSATITLIENDTEKAVWTNRKNGVIYNWTYTPTITGSDIPLIIKCDNEEATIIINIEKLNINNSEVSGYSFRFKAAEMADNENVIDWAKENNRASFSEDFDWVNGGLHTDYDEKGNPRQYLLIKAGDRLTLNTYPFEKGKGASSNGLSMKIIYKAIECKDYDAEFLTCYEIISAMRSNSSEELDLEIPNGTNLQYSGKVNIKDQIPSLDLSTGGTIEYDSTDISILDTLNKKYFIYEDNIYYFSYRLDANQENAIVITINPTYIVQSGIGVKMRAQEAEFSCSSASITVPYYEESYIELEFDVSKNISGSKAKYIKPWLDGVPCGIAIYDNSDKMEQTNPAKPIVIGSDDCDVCLYLFKIYEKSLSDDEHLENFIADALNSQEMLDRYKRNDILNEGLTEKYKTPIIDYTKLSKNNPNCHVHVYSIEKMTTTKKDSVGVYSYAQYLDNKKILSTKESQISEGIRSGPLSETERNLCPAQIKVQGTSSAAYGLAAFNLDSDFTQNGISSLLDENGNELPNGWSMDEDAQPCTFFCTKVNVASCEGANNALNQEWYNYHQPYIGAAKKRNYDENGNLKSGPKYRDTMQFKPGVVFIKDWNQKTTESVGVKNNIFKELDGYTAAPFFNFYSIGCMGNSKDNTHVFHTPTECCIENNDNQLPGQWMTITPGSYTVKVDNVEQTYYVDLDSLDGTTKVPELDDPISNRTLWENSLDNVYSFRYPDMKPNELIDNFVDENNSKINPVTGKKYADEMIEGWFRFVNWMSTSDPMPRYEKLEITSEEEFNNLKTTYTSFYKKVDIGNDDIDYELVDNFDDSNFEYYYETVHIHGPTGKRLRGPTGEILQDPIRYIPHKFRGDEYSKTLANVTVDTYAREYTHDTSDYRMAKMLYECEDYLVMDSVVYHYLFIERHTMIDNVAKNTFWSSSDYKHWDLTKDYDNDTADGNDNQGKLTLTYGLEIGDKIKGSSVFNAGNSVWLHFIRKLPTVTRAMYEALDKKSHAWDADSYLNKFNEWQNAIPERCWIADYYRKYVRPWEIYNDSGFLPRMEGGKKTHQREQYERYQYDYLSSKNWLNTESSFGLRPKTGESVKTDLSITFETYADGYFNMSIGGQESSRRVKRNTPFTWEYSGILHDATFYIYNPKNIQAIGDENKQWDNLSKLKTATIDGLSDCIKLRKLIISKEEDNIVNNQLTNLQVDGAKMLETLYACNIHFKNDNNNDDNTKEIAKALDLSTNKHIKYVDGRNSLFSIVTIADGAPLENLYLSNPTGLNMSNLTDFKEYEADYENMQQLKLDNIDKSEINSRTLIDNVRQYASNFNDYSLKNVNWIINNSNDFNSDKNGIKILDYLLEDENLQSIKAESASRLTGKLIITSNAYNEENALALYEKYSNKNIYPNLDIEFQGENAKLYTVNVLDGNGKNIWKRKVNKNTSLSETFFTGENNYIPSYGVLKVDEITKMDTSTITYIKTGKWNIYNADMELIAQQVESDENGYPIYPNNINSDIIIEHCFDETTRHYEVLLYDGNDEILHTFKDVTYQTELKDVLSRIVSIPYKDDSALGLKETYNYIGYHYIQNSKNALPNNYKIMSDVILYPVFEKVDDITLLTPHYEYFDFVKDANSVYDDSGILNSYSIKKPGAKYHGYRVQPKPNIILRGKVVLPIFTEQNEIITIYSSFASQREITHIFFEKRLDREANHLFELGDRCFQNMTKLEYFEFHDNLGRLKNYSLSGISLNPKHYNNNIVLGNNLRIIQSYALNGTFAISTATTANKKLIIPPSTLLIEGSGISANAGLAGFIIEIGNSKEFSNLTLIKDSAWTDTQWFGCIGSNTSQLFGGIVFYTQNYKLNDELVKFALSTHLTFGKLTITIIDSI